MHCTFCKSVSDVETCDCYQVSRINTTTIYIGVFSQLHRLVCPWMVADDGLQYLLPEHAGIVLCRGTDSTEVHV